MAKDAGADSETGKGKGTEGDPKPGADGNTGEGGEGGELKLTPKVTAEIDRRVQAARQKWETEHKAELDKAKTEAEADKLKSDGKWKELAERFEKLEVARASEATQAALRTETVELLGKKGMVWLVPAFTKPLATIEERKTFVEDTEKDFKAAVETEVKKRLTESGKPPGKTGAEDKSAPATGLSYPSMAKSA